MTNLFKKLAADPAIKRNLKTVVKGNPDQKYTGEDGELLVELIKVEEFETKEKVPCYSVTFAVIDGDHAGEKVNIFHHLAGNSARSFEDQVSEMFGTIAALGVDCDGREDDLEGISQDVEKRLRAKAQYKVLITDAKEKYPDVRILSSLASAPSSSEEPEEAEHEEVEETEEDVSLKEIGGYADEGNEEAIEELSGYADEAGLDPDEFATWVDLATELESLESDEEDSEEVPQDDDDDEEELEEDEWPEAEDEAEGPEESESDEDEEPASAWLEFEAWHSTDGTTAYAYTVVGADDEARTVDLKKGRKTIKGVSLDDIHSSKEDAELPF